MLLNDAKCQGYSFYRFLVIKGKPTGECKITPVPTPKSTRSLRDWISHSVYWHMEH